LAACGLGTLVAIGLWSRATSQENGAVPQDVVQLYTTECRICHGPEGRGDGDAAYLLFPKPRDFTRGQFKVRSTPTGEPPTDDDLFHTVSNGLPGSAMPGFARLSEEQRRELVAYVKQLAGITAPPRATITVPDPPPLSDALLARGKLMYNDVGCEACHGATGRGDGESAPTLKDERGYPAPPNDFTRGIYKGGGTLEDIYLRFQSGMAGTPMPSYEGTFEREEDNWALAYYVKSLGGPKVAVQPTTGDIPISRHNGVLPTDPGDPAWSAVESANVPLMLLWQRQTAPEHVRVRALENGYQVAVRLEWDDEQVAGRPGRTTEFADGASVAFALQESPPTIAMGDAQNPVNFWQWRMDWQVDLVQRTDVDDAFPHMAVDRYAGQRKPAGTPFFGGVMRSAEHQDPTYLTAMAAGNDFASLGKQPFMNLAARGFGTLEPLPADRQVVSGAGRWAFGHYEVVFVRDLRDADTSEVDFRRGQPIPVAFAVWDGDKGDRDGQKSVTSWYFLTWPE